jgi:hypothetical protein
MALVSVSTHSLAIIIIIIIIKTSIHTTGERVLTARATTRAILLALGTRAACVTGCTPDAHSFTAIYAAIFCLKVGSWFAWHIGLIDLTS